MEIAFTIMFASLLVASIATIVFIVYDTLSHGWYGGFILAVFPLVSAVFCALWLLGMIRR